MTRAVSSDYRICEHYRYPYILPLPLTMQRTISDTCEVAGKRTFPFSWADHSVRQEVAAAGSRKDSPTLCHSVNILQSFHVAPFSSKTTIWLKARLGTLASRWSRCWFGFFWQAPAYFSFSHNLHMPSHHLSCHFGSPEHCEQSYLLSAWKLAFQGPNCTAIIKVPLGTD